MRSSIFFMIIGSSPKSITNQKTQIRTMTVSGSPSFVKRSLCQPVWSIITSPEAPVTRLYHRAVGANLRSTLLKARTLPRGSGSLIAMGSTIVVTKASPPIHSMTVRRWIMCMMENSISLTPPVESARVPPA